MLPEADRRIPAALLILRFFLVLFLLQWSIEKLILPDAAARIARSFYGVTLPDSIGLSATASRCSFIP